MVGSQEQEDYPGKNMVDNLIGMHEVLGGMGFSEEEITYKVVDGGVHEPSLWGPEFRDAYLWLFPQEASSASSLVNNTDLHIYPNPASNTIRVKFRVR